MEKQTRKMQGSEDGQPMSMKLLMRKERGLRMMKKQGRRSKICQVQRGGYPAGFSRKKATREERLGPLTVSSKAMKRLERASAFSPGLEKRGESKRGTESRKNFCTETVSEEFHKGVTAKRDGQGETRKK